MSGKLLLICLLVVIGFSLSVSSSYRDLIRYTRQVNILFDMLEAEGCDDPLTKGLQRREIIGASNLHDYDIEVQVQKALYRQLKAVLVECRSVAMKKEMKTTMRAATTTTTTATTTPITTTQNTIAPTTIVLTTTPSTSTTRRTTDPCQSALNLTEGWRQEHKGGNITPDGKYNCDTKGMIANGRPWFRFSGAAGNHLMNKCVPLYSCGTGAALWSDDVMPTQVGVVTQVRSYGRLDDNCRYASFTRRISVVRCSTSPHDFVYRYDGSDHCDYGFCGMTA